MSTTIPKIEVLEVEIPSNSLVPSSAACERQGQTDGIFLHEGPADIELETELEQPVTVTIPGPGQVIKGRSKVWEEFVVMQDGRKVMCRRCGECLAYSVSHSTSSMLKHLKRKHKLDMYPATQSPDVGDLSPSSTTNSPRQPKKRTYKPRKLQLEDQPSPNESSESSTSTPYVVSVSGNSVHRSPILFSDPCIRLRWTDHSDSFLKTVYHDSTYTDVTIVAEKQFFKAHRLILSSASELFDETFKITPDGQHPIMFLKDVKSLELRILLEFIYKGEVSIPPNLIPDLVRVGTDLKVKGLTGFEFDESVESSSTQDQQHSEFQTMHPEIIATSDSDTHLHFTNTPTSIFSSATDYNLNSGAILKSDSDGRFQLQLPSHSQKSFQLSQQHDDPDQNPAATTDAPKSTLTIPKLIPHSSGTPVRVKNILTNRIISTVSNPIQVRISNTDNTNSLFNGPINTDSPTCISSIPQIKQIRLMPNAQALKESSGAAVCFNVNPTTGAMELGSLEASVGTGETILMLADPQSNLFPASSVTTFTPQDYPLPRRTPSLKRKNSEDPLPLFDIDDSSSST